MVLFAIIFLIELGKIPLSSELIVDKKLFLVFFKSLLIILPSGPEPDIFSSLIPSSLAMFRT